MTPEQASGLIRYFEEYPKRVHRYKLEGGTRRQWNCLLCGWATEAHDEAEAISNLATCPVACKHTKMQSTDRYAPPDDFT